jgi:glutamine synthetase type III
MLSFARLGQPVAAVSTAGVEADTQTKMLERVCDLIATLGTIVDAKLRPAPSYAEMLFAR